jgi:hypothetical protein
VYKVVAVSAAIIAAGASAANAALLINGSATGDISFPGETYSNGPYDNLYHYQSYGGSTGIANGEYSVYDTNSGIPIETPSESTTIQAYTYATGNYSTDGSGNVYDYFAEADAYYSGTISSSGRVVAGAYGYSNNVVGIANSTYGYSVGGRSPTYTSGAVSIFAAANGDSVSATSHAFGNAAYTTVAATTGIAEIGVADAPNIGVYGITPYLSPATGPITQSNLVPFEFGISSGTAFRDFAYIPGLGCYASPFDDQLDVVGNLFLNGTSVQTFDYNLDFSPDDATTSQFLSLATDSTQLNLDLSGIQGPTATIELQYSAVATAFDANGVGTPTTLLSGSAYEVLLLSSIIWNNAGGSGDGVTWDTVNQNWQDTSGPTIYNDGSNVTFNDNSNCLAA